MKIILTILEFLLGLIAPHLPPLSFDFNVQLPPIAINLDLDIIINFA